MQVLDSYDLFIKEFKLTKENLFEFGIKYTIFPQLEKVEEQWKNLKHRIYNNGVVSIRRYGRSSNNQMFIDLYKYLFNNRNVRIDPTNNLKPQKVLSELTGHKRNVDLFNYQVSHTFSRTKNIFLFEAGWNLTFTPKIVDPLTGHEAKGRWPEEYQGLFLLHVMEKYQSFIDNYNQIVTDTDFLNQIDTYLCILKKSSGTTSQVIQFEKDLEREFAPILIHDKY